MSESLRSVRAIKEGVERIYREANAYADKAGGVNYGMNILLGPPIGQPAVMIVSLQGGGDDRKRQTRWPDRLVYATPETNRHRFGKILRADFIGNGLQEVLDSRTVASNIVFPQWPSKRGGFGGWCSQPGAGAWRERSRRWLEELVDLMAPRVILTYGKPAFEELTNTTKTKGELGHGRFRNAEVVGCGHLIQGADILERKSAMLRIGELVVDEGGGSLSPLPAAT